MRNVEKYLDLSRYELIGKLAIVTLELMNAHDQIGFLRSQELTKKRDAWVNIVDDSIQRRDRNATYAAADETIELTKAEAERALLVEERNFLQLLIEYAH